MTAATKPGGRVVGGDVPNCCVRERVFKEGGATWAAPVATWAQVFMHRVMLVGVVGLQSFVACHFWRHSRLDKSASLCWRMLFAGRWKLSRCWTSPSWPFVGAAKMAKATAAMMMAMLAVAVES
jgi:hypothetical protein